MPYGLLDRVLYEGKTQQLANTERGQAQAHCICMGTAISGCPQVAVQSWRGQEFPLLPCAPLFCGTIQSNQILLFFFFFKQLKMAQALLSTHNQIHIFFSVQWLPRAKVQAGTLKYTA